MNDVSGLEDKIYNLGNVSCEKLSEFQDGMLKDLPVNNLDLSSSMNFQESFDFSEMDHFRRNFCTARDGFSSISSSFIEGNSGALFDFSGHDAFPMKPESSTGASFLTVLDGFMRETFSKSSRFALGFPLIFVGAELFQLSKVPGILTVGAGILLLGLGQCYRECPEGLDG